MVRAATLNLPAGLKSKADNAIRCLGVAVDRQAFTILGASGFIGRALVAWLESGDHVVHAVTRASLPALLASRRPAGHVIDCVGITNDCRLCPLDTAEAHVGLVARCLTELKSESFLLLSSTRVYAHAGATHEDATLSALPSDPADLYNLTKLAGEALCLADPRSTTRVARLSDVYGMDMPAATFLGGVLHQGHATGTAMFHQSPASARDYVSVAAVARLLPAIASTGRHRLYNIAAGATTDHADIADRLRDIAGWQISFAFNAPTVRHPPIDTTRINNEFGPTCSDLLADLPALLALGQEAQCSPSMRHMAA